MLRSYKKLNFYTTFKAGVYISEYLIRPYQKRKTSQGSGKITIK